MAWRSGVAAESNLEDWRTLRKSGRRMFRQGLASFAENDLLSFASAIAFQALFALVPLTLAALALLGFLNLEEIWRTELAPQVDERLRPDAASVVKRTAAGILGERQGLWLTFGLAFALWQVSSAIRAASGPLNLIYEAGDDDRPAWRRFLVSLGLAAAIAPLIVGAALLVQAGPWIIGRFDLAAGVGQALRVLRWGAAVALLFVAVYLLIRFLPARPQSFPWAGVGSVLVVASWLVASLAFGLYATRIAAYGSVFGSLASVIVLMSYFYVASVALLFGVQLDACVRREVRERSEDGRPEA